MPEKWDFSKIKERKKFDELLEDKKNEIIGESWEQGTKENDELGEKEIKSETETVETELSLEVIEKIMEKVQDVNQEGTAFTVLKNRDLIQSNLSKLETTLKWGLVSTDFVKKYALNESTQEKNLGKIKNDMRNNIVFSNIIGRDINELSRNYFKNQGEYGLIYNLDGYTELSPYALALDRRFAPEKSISHTYRAFGGTVHFRDFDIEIFLKTLNIIDESVDHATFKKIVEENKSKLLDAGFNVKLIEQIEKSENYEFVSPIYDNGFMIMHRVAPRKFEGVILTNLETKTDQQYTLDSQIVNTRVSAVLRAMGKITKEVGKNRFLPIYDINGNLLWPKQMSYEEVKKFVAERDKKRS